ncbi:MAG: NUDIX hydrolase [Thermodesulfobacteriota bacterium]
MVKDWKLKNSEAMNEYRIFKTRRDVRLSPRTGKEHDFFVIESPDWVNIVAVTEDEDIVFINQFRHGISRPTLEIPGGMIDKGEKPVDSARRELLEETGYASEKFIEIGLVHPNPAIFNNACYTFLALSAEKVSEPEFEGTEDIENVLYPVSKIDELIKNREITHSLVLNALYFFQKYQNEY